MHDAPLCCNLAEDSGFAGEWCSKSRDRENLPWAWSIPAQTRVGGGKAVAGRLEGHEPALQAVDTDVKGYKSTRITKGLKPGGAHRGPPLNRDRRNVRSRFRIYSIT